VAQALSISDQRAWFLAGLFNAEYYRVNASLDFTDAETLFSDYIERGIHEDLSPSPTTKSTTN